MRDLLPNKIKKVECGIANLDSFEGNGTHWVCYFKKDKIKNQTISHHKDMSLVSLARADESRSSG